MSDDPSAAPAARVRHVELTLDCADVDRVAAFWMAALGYTSRRDGEHYTSLHRRDGAVPNLVLQPVPEPKVGKLRLHLDLYVDDVRAEIERLVALGATVLSDWIEGEGESWVVLADPEGNELCVCEAAG